MFKDIFLFEIRYRLKRPAPYLYFLLFFIMVFGAMASDNITIGEQAGNLLRNSPAAIFRITAIMSAFGMLITSAIMSTPVLRDYEHNTHHLLYSYPLSRFSYLAGRFLGSYVFVIFVFLSIPLGIMAGSLVAPAAGWIEASRFDSFRLMAYISPFLILVLTNAFFSGAIFFCLASLSRKMIYSYLGSVLLLVIYIGSTSLLMNLESKHLAAILDPFGIASYFIDTEYWTPAELNSQLIPLSGKLLINRILWTIIGFLLLGFTYIKFKLQTVSEGKQRKVKAVEAEARELTTNVHQPKVKQVFSKISHFRQMLSLGWLEFVNTIREVPFIGIVAAGVVLLFTNAISIGQMFGTNTLPVTYNILEYSAGNFALFVFIIITFYSGEIIWRERGYGINQITDSLPLPNWVFAGSKLWAMLLILVLLQTVLFIVNIATQISHGFFEFNLPLYFTELYANQLPTYFMLTILVMLIQTFSKNKFVGHAIVMFYYIIFYLALGLLNVNHLLWKFPQVPPSPYSDMNGFGHFLMAVRWYQLAWVFLSAAMVAIMILFWNRGFNLTLLNRFRVAQNQFTGALRVSLLVGLAGFIVVGGFIVYNTTILNEFQSAKETEKLQVKYENTYKKYEGIPQPKIQAVSVKVDIYPNERDVFIGGTYLMRNETGFPIDSVHFILQSSVDIIKCEIGENSRLVLNDKELGYFIIELDEPLMPNDSIDFDFKVEIITRGFTNDGGNTSIVQNGTFFSSFDYFPTIGYQPRGELSDRDKRRKYNLPEKERMAPITDTIALQRSYLGPIGDWIEFEAIVSTIPGQIAIAPGYLEREWIENGRRYFHYKPERPILNFYSFMSAEFEVLEDKWNDVDLKVYYHKGHDYNIHKMMESMKTSLDYFTENFSPFQHRELRVIEFPRYGRFAQSFPTTMPYSESIGFIANLKDEEDIDYVYYVTAHETAHQWWAHQVIGADVQGATLMSEALAQYSALMVMEKRYGKEQMRKFLKHELDGYLRGRRREMRRELPITFNENQGYIHYSKGSLLMYALRDYIGEKNVNRALASYLDDWAYQPPPFSTSADFMKYIYAETPDSLRSFVYEMFEDIVLYDIRTKDAVAEKLDDGRYKVSITADMHKFRADSLGVETPIELNDWIDVGILTTKEVDGKKRQVELYMQKHLITSNNPTFEIIVDEKPEIAGLDPYNKLITRHSDSNRMRVK